MRDKKILNELINIDGAEALIYCDRRLKDAANYNLTKAMYGEKDEFKLDLDTIKIIKNRAGKQVIKNALADEEFVPKTILEVFDVYKESALLQAVTQSNCRRLSVSVVGTDENDNFIIVGSHDFINDSARLFVEEIEETMFYIDRDSDNTDVISQLLSNRRNETLEAKIIATLNADAIVGDNGALQTALSKAISKLSKINKDSISIIVSPETYILNLDFLDKASNKFNVIVSGSVEAGAVYVGNISKLLLNSVLDKVRFQKDSRTGKFTFAMNVYDFDAKVIDTKAIVKFTIA